MPHLLGRAVWDHDGVRDDLRAYLVEQLGDPAAVLVIAEAGGRILAATVRTTPAQVRAWHPSGMADPEGLPGWAVSRRWCTATTLPKVSGWP